MESDGGALYLGSVSLLDKQVKPKKYITVSKGNMTCALRGVEFSDNWSVYGGAIASIRVSNISIVSSEFLRNSASYGGAMYVESDGSVEPQMGASPEHYVSGVDTVFEANVGNESGGALFLRVGFGGAPLSRSGISPLGISRGIFTNRVVVPNNEDDAFFESSRFANNRASVAGGAWYVERGRAGCRDCVFNANSVESGAAGDGGAMCLRDLSAFHGRNVSLTRNSAGCGGGLSARDSLVNLVEARVRGNAAEQQGGGLYISVETELDFYSDTFGRVESAVVEDNTAQIGGGLFLQMKPFDSHESPIRAAFMMLRSANFTNNVAAANGGAIFTNAPSAVELGCDCSVGMEETSDHATMTGRRGRFSSEEALHAPRAAAVREGILDHPDLCNRTLFGNGVREYGSHAVATTAVSAKVYRHGSGARIDEGQAFSILNHSSGSNLEPFDVVLVDSFGNPAVAYPRTLIRVASDSPDVALSGQLITEASSRTALSRVGLLSSIGKRHNLTLYFEPDIGRNISIGVDVRGCLPGEFAVDVEGVGAAQHCKICDSGLYNFDPAGQRAIAEFSAARARTRMAEQPREWVTDGGEDDETDEVPREIRDESSDFRVADMETAKPASRAKKLSFATMTKITVNFVEALALAITTQLNGKDEVMWAEGRKEKIRRMEKRKNFMERRYEEMLRGHDFLYVGYDEKCKYWEAVVMVRRASLAAVSVFSFSLGNGAQSFLSMIILLVAGIVHAWKMPYGGPGNVYNLAEMLSLFCPFMVFLLGIMVTRPHVQESVATKRAIVWIAIALVLVVFLYLLDHLLLALLEEIMFALENRMRKVYSGAKAVSGALENANASVFHASKALCGLVLLLPSGIDASKRQENGMQTWNKGEYAEAGTLLRSAESYRKA
eukprot:evm.model.scf_14.3 EVM.evm.TU.scf_14.3   scf_14:68209-75299(-)